ncbi:hypothetical protein SteCoe_4763 [Stentor coeruleus]|uniref:Uncharacterized protein n=1 Tax=Stentor coeruleus TaxID=5963 RepID=A0A1R2CTR8_9CILI|nr:hypothetical protein SteCoe_4763 [Stentor coeruleus]
MVTSSLDLHSTRNRVDYKTLQDIASEKLSRGASTKTIRCVTHENTFAGPRSCEFENPETEEDQKQVTELIENLLVLKDMKEQLLLNYSICKKELPYNQINLSGLFFVLKDKLKMLSSDARIDFNGLSQELVALNPIVRELIRAQKSKGLVQGADLLELIWRMLVKLLDNACYSHFLTSKMLADKVQTESRAIFTEKQNEIAQIKDLHALSIEKVIAENSQLKDRLALIKNDFEATKQELVKKNDYLKDLFKFDNREKDMENLKKLIGGVDKFIFDTEREQARRIIALKNVASVIKAAKKAYKKPKIASVSIQTDPFNLDVININTKYEDYIRTFGTTFGNIGSFESINAFVSLVKKDLEPKSVKRSMVKRKTKN